MGVSFAPTLQPSKCAKIRLSLASKNAPKSFRVRLPSSTIGRLFITLLPILLAMPSTRICPCFGSAAKYGSALLSKFKIPLFFSPKTTIKSPKEKMTMPKGALFRLVKKDNFPRIFPYTTAANAQDSVKTHRGR